MRNPAPLVLTLLLAATASFLMIRGPKDAPTPPTVTADSTPEQPATTDAAPAIEPEAAGSRKAWPHESSDIPADPEITFGQLPNGLRYIIQPNAEPPARVSIRLHIAAGSLMEAEDQRGLAHFLEHMVFNGSKNFTPNELIPRMQRLGIAFGAHANAYTSFDETVYMLDLPDLSEEMLTLGFTVMRDFADGALLEPEEIEKERDVILSEKTSRDSVSYRIMEKQFSTLLPDSLITRRFPIGTEEVIRKAPRERFVDFYTKYYIPSRMTFVVTGDVDPADFSRRIANAFGTLADPAEPGPEPDLGTITPTDGLEPLVFTDKELPSTELGLMAIADYQPRPDTRATRTEDLRMYLANAMLGLRFDRLAKQSGSPILGGSASKSDLFQQLILGSVDVRVADGRLEDAIPVLENEFRRALEFGFTKAELHEASANLLNAYDQAVKTAASRKSDDLATATVQSINAGSVLSTPETDLEIARAALKDLTPADCQAAFTGFWKSVKPRLILTAPQATDDIATTLREAFTAAAGTQLEAPEEIEVPEFAYTDFGPAGKIDEEREVEGLGVTTWTLSNGVTVNLKRTDFEKNRISLSARIGDGRLTAPTDKIGLTTFANAVVAASGIGSHRAEELQRILAGRNVGTGFDIQEDAFVIAGSTTPDDLTLQLQLMAARLVHPVIREEIVEQYRKTVPMTFQELAHTPQGPMQQMSAWLRGDDPRFAFPESADVLLTYTADDVLPWLEKAFTPAPVELNIVGDFDPAALQTAVLQTFGALPDRPERKDLPKSARTLEMPEAPIAREFTFQSKIPQGNGIALWKIPGPRGNQQQFRRLNLLADILSDRLREEIREKLGASYSPQASANGSTAIENFGFIIAYSVGTPEDVVKLATTATEIAASLAKSGATEDELDRARAPFLGEIDKSLRDNAYWLETVLSGSTADPSKFELARNRKEDIKSITLEEINALAKEHLGSDQAIQVTIRPAD